jgi:hypothetical protein
MLVAGGYQPVHGQWQVKHKQIYTDADHAMLKEQ